jgi:hypothetical protein
VVEYAAWHIHLLPSAEGRGKRKRPEYEKTYGTHGGFIDPSARANLDVHRIFHLPEHDVERRRHADDLPPTADFLNLQKLAAILRFQSLAFEFLTDEPILDRSEQLLITRRRAWKTAALRHYFLQYCAAFDTGIQCKDSARCCLDGFSCFQTVAVRSEPIHVAGRRRRWLAPLPT